MTTEKIKTALGAFGDLLTALEPFGWDAGPLRARVEDARVELREIEAAPGDVGQEPIDTELAELLAGLDDMEPVYVEAGPARFPAHLL